MSVYAVISAGLVAGLFLGLVAAVVSLALPGRR